MPDNERIGEAFENLTEDLKLSMETLIVLIAVGELVRTLLSESEDGTPRKESF